MKKVSPHGFTLIELMIVVAIIGVLAGVSYGVYSSYIKSARAAEANGILSDIRLKQEAYRATFHQYACSDVCAEEPARSGAQWTTRMAWTTTAANWMQLGIRPDAGLWYSYSVVSGSPGAAVPGPRFNNLGVATANDFWYAAIARQDFNNDGSFGCMAVQSGLQIVKVFDPCPL